MSAIWRGEGVRGWERSKQDCRRGLGALAAPRHTSTLCPANWCRSSRTRIALKAVIVVHGDYAKKCVTELVAQRADNTTRCGRGAGVRRGWTWELTEANWDYFTILYRTKMIANIKMIFKTPTPSLSDTFIFIAIMLSINYVGTW